MSSESAIEVMRSDGVVPLVSTSDESSLRAIVDQATQAGVHALEVTLRQDGAVDALERVNATHSGQLTLGAGTVLNAEQADRVIGAGAQFVFSPVLDLAVGQRCVSSDVAWIPGCATATEVKAALDAGCTAVKLFPADTLGGPAFLRALRSVFGDFVAIPSGGIVPHATALREWYGAGAAAVGIGSAIVSSQLVADQAWPAIGSRFSAALAAARDARSSGGIVA